MKTVYVETSIISYLTARPARDIVAAARQQLTIDWWEGRRTAFDLYVSSVVEDEASRGDPDAAARRLAEIKSLPRLSITEEVSEFARLLIRRNVLPENALDDALHIALAAVHGTDYLLTWNCRHIDNAQTKPLIRYLCLDAGLPYPEICTPEELMGDVQNG
jgi:hypothetical protein